ncbi:Uncharacterized protein YqjZ, partial [Pseudomonas sp. FEN]
DRPDTTATLLRRDLHLPAHRGRSRLRRGGTAHARTGPGTTGLSRRGVGPGRGWPGHHRVLLEQRSGDPSLETTRRAQRNPRARSFNLVPGLSYPGVQGRTGLPFPAL